jgi:hypothetical protein
MIRPRRAGAVLAALALVALAAAAPAAAQGDGAAERMTAATAFPFAELQGLDKVTARVSRFSAPVDVPVEFGSLTVRVRACWKNPPESAAYIEITDRTLESSEPVFAGWMYASSPAVNGLEHPVFDVWVLDCLESEPAPPEATGGGEGEQKG